MEERTIIKGEQGNIGGIRNTIFGIGIAVGIILSFTGMAGSSPTIIDHAVVAAVFFIPFLLIGLLFTAWASKVSITVTDKRVYGTAAFGKRVDLPIDTISSVGTSMLNGIAVASASGVIKFMMIKNRDAIHEAISRLLMERQERQRR